MVPVGKLWPPNCTWPINTLVEGPEAAFYVVYKYFHTYYFLNLEIKYHNFTMTSNDTCLTVPMSNWPLVRHQSYYTHIV